jgi:hypothetical protein
MAEEQEEIIIIEEADAAGVANHLVSPQGNLPMPEKSIKKKK